MIVKAPKRKRLCIVCPCYNEAEAIGQFYQRLTEVLVTLHATDYRIQFIDDGSTDDTLAKLNEIAERDPRVTVYSLSRNFGHQVALSAGLDAAVGDAVIMMDSDLQHPPEVIPEMVDKWLEGSDIVSAIRTSTADSSLLKRATAGGFYWLMNRFGDTPIIPNAADFCLLSRRAHQALCAMPERHRFLRGMVSWIGFSRALVPYTAAARVAGQSKYTTRKMVNLALNACFSFSTAPIKLASRLGVFVVLFGFVYLAYIVARYLLLGDLVLGWGSLMCITLVLGGLQLVFIGLIGEYLARVFEETKRRPLYFFKQQPSDGQQETAASAAIGWLDQEKLPC